MTRIGGPFFNLLKLRIPSNVWEYLENLYKCRVLDKGLGPLHLLAIPLIYYLTVRSNTAVN
jgi:hypothetical protein